MEQGNKPDAAKPIRATEIARRPEGGAALERKRTSEVIKIGQDGVIVRRTDGGVVRSLQARIVLSKARKELTLIKGDYSISAAGYQRLNGVASINIVTPPTVIVDGVAQPNPHIHRDKHGTVEFVFVRKIGLGRSKIGNLVAQDSTLYFNLRAYLVAMLHKRELIEKGVVEIMSVAAWDALDEKGKAGKWFLPTIPGLGLKVDIAAPEFLDVHKSYSELVQFADRRAATICARNVLKAHPGLAASIVQAQGGRAVVDVMGWPASDADFRRMDEAASAISRGEAPPEGVDVMETGTIQADPEDAPEGFGDPGEASGPGEVIDVEPVEGDTRRAGMAEAEADEDIPTVVEVDTARQAPRDSPDLLPDPGAQDGEAEDQPDQAPGRPEKTPSNVAGGNPAHSGPATKREYRHGLKCLDCRDAGRVPYQIAGGNRVGIPCPSCQPADDVAAAMAKADALADEDPKAATDAAGAYAARQAIEEAKIRGDAEKGRS